MMPKRIVHSCAAALACLLAAPALGQDVDPEAIVNALFAAGGNHQNVRASGAKGICVSGTFARSADPVVSLPEGVAAPNDPMFEIHSLSYAISLSRRRP